uniref:probable disease resistance protein At4g27220 isoform X2 n=1 Tax=Fragaria vesca subsp. vesca TaxID=101020 RepID=UPI0005CAAFAA|nr:PREDICTED: probable disease resistance protein At4g27220 isoform X2 [Fragaria vesca subsp. vesca]
MASSSQIACASPPSSDSCWKYDVFLSFRGPDTRKGITVDIYNRLNSRGINTFMDEQGLHVGDVITPALFAAIKESSRILPLFYQVDPTDVRYQKKSFEKAFFKHETSGRHESEKVNQWRAALNKVANISGWNTNDHKTHKELVDVIVEVVLSKVGPEAIELTSNFQAFEATIQAMDELQKALIDDEVTAVGVYGMGGVGKTTLVEHVGVQAQKSGIFNYVTKGVVSQNPDFEKLQDALAEQLSFKLHEKTEIGRATRLHKEIMRRTKILLILDDIWEGMELSRIGIPSYKELRKCNSKVLLTTRIWNVCHAMECQRKITLNVLSEQDSWALFVRRARRSFESTTFENVARKVAGECCGLPIALIAVARALGDKDLVEWKRAAQRLEKSQTANPDDIGEASKCIRLSYDCLKDKEYKSYFLLCCLFPEDYDIPIEDLFKYAIGKGLFQDAETLEEARDRADSVARHLKYSSLLLDGKNYKFLRMHDVVRDAALQISQSEDGHGFLVKAGCGLLDWPRQLNKGYSAVSLMLNHIRKLPEMLVCPKLQILLLNNNYSIEEMPDTFFQIPNELRVLDLSSTSVSILPLSFSLLTNLQALYLDNCMYLKTDTSILGKLKKLEILRMRNSGVKELSIEIGYLTNLRMLDITGNDIARIPSKVISKLHNLEELYMEGFLDWESEVEGERREETNAGFDEVTSLSNLRVLTVRLYDTECLPQYVDFKPNLVEFNIRVGIYDPFEMTEFHRYVHNSLWLKLDIISRLPEWFCDEIMNRAESLVWREGRRLTGIFVESEYGRLQGLKHLFVVGPRRNKLMKSHKTISAWLPKRLVFENLEELYLWNVDCGELCAVEFLPPGSLSNLKVFEVRLCYNWGNEVLPSTLLQRLLNLEELICDYMDGSKYVFGHEALIVSKELKLRKIELSSLVTVSICDGPAPPAMFRNLQTLSIKWCKQLQGSLFSYDVAQCLSQLNCLELEECLCLERIVEASNKKIILPKLEKLRLVVLPMLCYESATFDIECPSLEHLELWDCPVFSASSSDFRSRKQVHLKLERSGLW